MVVGSQSVEPRLLEDVGRVYEIQVKEKYMNESRSHLNKRDPKDKV